MQGYGDTIYIQGPHEVAGQAFLALPSKQIIFMSVERVR